MTKSSECRWSSMVAQADMGRENWTKLMMRVSIALLAAALGAVISGCGSSGATPGPTPTPTPTPNPTPTVTTLSPSSAPAGGLAFTLTVHGSNFVPVSTVMWNGSSRTTTFISSSQLQAHIMSVDLAAAVKVPITVVNPAPGGGTSNTATFTVPAATVAFQSGRALNGSDAANTNSVSNVWAMNPDGSAATPLTKLTAAYSVFPSWSPDGSKIAFASARALNGSDAANTNETFNIWVINADGSGATPLTKLTAAGARSGGSVWSPDGSKIAFTSARALDGSDAVNTNSTFNVWVMNADGSGAIPLTKLTAAGTSNSVAWSPDGSKIAFESQRALDGSDTFNTINGVFNIWVMNADGSGAIPLTKLTVQGSDNFDPAWLPGGSKLAFDSARALDGSNAINTNSAANIWVMNADGSAPSPLTKLTASGVDSSVLSWSPDGSKLAFESSRAVDGSNASAGKIFNLWVMNADGSSVLPLTKLTASGANSFNGIWSPDGSKVFFDSRRALNGADAANTNFTTNIWVVNADGSNATPLTNLTASGAESRSPNQP